MKNSKIGNLPLIGFSSLLMFSVALTACSNVDEAERLVAVNTVYVDTIATEEPDTTEVIDLFASVPRHVLIEDFTGQDCVNCPNATDLITQLQEMNGGHNNVVAVGIHSGPLGVKPSKNPQGLATDLGDTYYNYWKIEMQPYGVIDRSDGTLSTEWWSAKVSWDLYEDEAKTVRRSVPVNIWVKAEQTDNSKVDVEVQLAGLETTSAKLQLWVVEDNIVAFQKMPDGSTNPNYQHNHVLRDAVNGAWGEDFTVSKDQVTTINHVLTLNNVWKPADLSIVAFVYNDDGVVQVVRQAIKIKD